MIPPTGARHAIDWITGAAAAAAAALPYFQQTGSPCRDWIILAFFLLGLVFPQPSHLLRRYLKGLRSTLPGPEDDGEKE